jgi:hypothetical protein
MKDGVKIDMRRIEKAEMIRKPVLVSLGCHYPRAMLPHPDPSCPYSMRDGASKRICSDPSLGRGPRPGYLEKLRGFTRHWLRVLSGLVPLSATANTGVLHWLDKTIYPQHRKAALYNCHSSISNHWDVKYFCNKCFMKDECYLDWKYPRGIMSRTDEFKTMVGPIFKLIEEKLFSLPWFIKKIPRAEWPDYISKVLGDGVNFVATDYTAFEATFTADMMNACEFELYDYMTQELPEHDEFMNRMYLVIAGRQKCIFKDFDVFLDATRMSGEMNTSLGNGFSNLMFMLFAASESGIKYEDARGVIEGDDGLFCFPDGAVPNTQIFKDLGADIKLEVHDKLSEASFCGLVFDEEDRMNVCDPVRMILSFGWTSHRYLHSNSRKTKLLLRAKALSLGYQFAGCPMLTALARYGFRVTEGVHTNELIRYIRNSNDINDYQRQLYLDAICKHTVLNAPIGHRTRDLVERKYGIPVEYQLFVENWLDSRKVIEPLDIPNLDLFCRDTWLSYFDAYSSVYADESGAFTPAAALK